MNNLKIGFLSEQNNSDSGHQLEQWACAHGYIEGYIL